MDRALPLLRQEVFDAHALLFAGELLTLQPLDGFLGAHLHRGRVARRALVVGYVVGVIVAKKYVQFTVDDGTGCVPCLLWTQQGDGDGDSTLPTPDTAKVPLVGDLLRVKGRITSYCSQVQLNCTSYETITDQHVELLHWLDAAAEHRQATRLSG